MRLKGFESGEIVALLAVEALDRCKMPYNEGLPRLDSGYYYKQVLIPSSQVFLQTQLIEDKECIKFVEKFASDSSSWRFHYGEALLTVS